MENDKKLVERAEALAKTLNLKLMTNEEALAKMQSDLDKAPPGWADKVLFTDNDGKEWTPNAIYTEVKTNSEWGQFYLKQFILQFAFSTQVFGADPESYPYDDAEAEGGAGDRDIFDGKSLS